MNNKNKKYIDQEEWIERLEEELNTSNNEERKKYLKIWINTIKCQPTINLINLNKIPQKKEVSSINKYEFGNVGLAFIKGYNACIDEILMGGE